MLGTSSSQIASDMAELLPRALVAAANFPTLPCGSMITRLGVEGPESQRGRKATRLESNRD